MGINTETKTEADTNLHIMHINADTKLSELSDTHKYGINDGSKISGKVLVSVPIKYVEEQVSDTLPKLTSTHKHIDAIIYSNMGLAWRITGFYGQLGANRQHETWSILRHLHSRYTMPWLCIGDYNWILSLQEKQGQIPKPAALMEAFRSALLHCNLIDLGYTRNKYTWNNGRHHGEFVQQRLD